MASPSVRLGLTPDVIRAALKDPDLRRLQTAWMAVNAGQWAYLVTNLVVAYEAGGAAATGLDPLRAGAGADRGQPLRTETKTSNSLLALAPSPPRLFTATDKKRGALVNASAPGKTRPTCGYRGPR